jgi:4-amino-4-deoxy-L-arabinose transferase-like glycosyltransferase
MLLAALLSTVAGIAGSLQLMWGQFAAGGALLAASALLLRWPRSIWHGPPLAEPSPRARRLALLGVCALAAFFRLYHLNPPGLWGDDALNGLLAYRILDAKIHSPFELVTHSHSTFHALSDYPIAGAFWLFGADLTTLRLPGIVLSLLCVPLLYATLSPLFGAPAALVAALFFASSPPQLTHAKQLVQIITGQFFQIAGLCLVVRGMAAGRTWMIAASGLPLALCLYTYHSARIAPLVAVAYALAVWVAGRRSSVVGRTAIGAVADASPAASDRPGPRLAYSAVAAVIVFALMLIPAVPEYVRAPAALVQRASDTSIVPAVRDAQSLAPLWQNTWHNLLMFHHRQGPEYHWFGLGFDPALNAVIGFLFLHGLVESLLRWREPRHVFALAWFGIGVLPALLSTGAPRLYRAFLALPPIYLWAALPLVRLAAAPAGRWSRNGLRALAIALAAAVPLIDFNYYFYRVYTHPAFRWFQGERMVDMARTLRDLGPGWTGYLLADNFDAGHEDFRFLARAWNLRIVAVKNLADVLPLRQLPEHGALFLMSHGALGAQAAIEQMYPGGEAIVSREPRPRSWWFDAWWPLTPPYLAQEISAAFYAVDRATVEHPNLQPPWGLDAEYQVSGNRIARREPYPYYAFLMPAFSQRFDVVWRGRLTVPAPGGYAIIVGTNGMATLWIDGRRLTAADLVAAGEHDFTLQVRDMPAVPRLRVYWGPPGQPGELIPPRAFAPPHRDGAATRPADEESPRRR